MNQTDEFLTDLTVGLYLSKAYELAANSTDKSNQNGAILVDPVTTKPLGQGANNFPPDVDWTEARATQRPTKYRYYEHSERWAVYDAARKGNKTEGAHMVCPWAACCDCARAMIVAGVSVLYLHAPRMLMTPDRWKDDVNEALNMLVEAGVLLRYYDEPITAINPILVNGERWSPLDKPVTEFGDTSSWAIGMEG